MATGAAKEAETDVSSTPSHFLCPITFEVMREPVVDLEGVTYEREAIEHWLNQGNMTSPVTQKPLTSLDLRPNRSLKEAIESYQKDDGEGKLSEKQDKKEPAEGETLVTEKEQTIDSKNEAAQMEPPVAPLNVGIQVSFDGSHLLLSLTPPPRRETTPSSICCVVDVSPSMDTPAAIQDEDGKEEQHGLSVLDITKHALKTVVKSLGPRDEFSLVSFDKESRIELEPMLMTESNVQTAMEKIEGLDTQGSTNLWSGLEEGLNLLMEHKPLTENVALFFLTDGLPHIRPEKGECRSLETFKEEKCGGQLPCRINTFGFGYSMDSKLLADLATIGGGSYSFIPDCGFVGTVFVNSVANHLTTVATDVSLNITALGMAILPGDYLTCYDVTKVSTSESDDVTVRFGSLQCGQSKDVVFPIKLLPRKGTPRLTAVLKHQHTSQGQEKTIGSTIFDLTDTKEKSVDIKFHLARLTLVKAINDALHIAADHDLKKKRRGLKG